MTKRILLALAFILCAGCQGQGANLRFSSLHHHPHNSLRVVSYNLNWGKDEDFRSDPAKTLEAIRRLQGDVLLLQETTKTWEKILSRQFAKTYPYQDYSPTDNGGGKAILSRFPILKRRVIPSAFGWYPCQMDLIKTPQGLIQIINVHLTPTFLPHRIQGIKRVGPFEAPNRRMQEVFHFLSHLKTKWPTIIGGDFNESDKGFALQYLRQAGFQDALSQNKAFFTWHRPFGPIVVKRRLDHVFYTQDLRAFRVQVLFEGGSDHYPLAVDFDRS